MTRNQLCVKVSYTMYVDYAKVDNFLCCSWIGLPPRDKYNSIDGGCGSNRAAAVSCMGYISCFISFGHFLYIFLLLVVINT